MNGHVRELKRRLGILLTLAVLGTLGCDDPADKEPTDTGIPDAGGDTSVCNPDDDPSAAVICADDTECQTGEVCGPSPVCVPSSCSCDPGSGVWGCTEDCGSPNVCYVPACEGPNPAEVETCVADDECDEGEVCAPSPDCVPSGCACEPATGTWACDADCGMPDVCQPGCTAPNPQGCAADADCATGEVCVSNENICEPSSCSCVSEMDTWACTDDCGGGLCQTANGPCTQDSDCPSGTQWCESGQCVDCDNTGLVCDLACPTGQELEERNGCFPCTCVDLNECNADTDCAAGETCTPGSFCLSWCPAGDPACCYGNLCQM